MKSTRWRRGRKEIQTLIRLRRKVEECLKKGTFIRVTEMAICGNGRPLLRKAPPGGDAEEKLYLWTACLPNGVTVGAFLDRPYNIPKQRGFSELVEAYATAIHEGVPVGGIELDPLGPSPRVVQHTGETGAWMIASRFIDDALRAAVAWIRGRAR